MMYHFVRLRLNHLGCAIALGATIALNLFPCTTQAQDRLKNMPGYERYRTMSREIPGSVKTGTLSVTWKEDGHSFEFRREGKSYRFDVATREATEIEAISADPTAGPARRGGRAQIGGPERGRQFASVSSPD